ncbi:MAG TPA: DUF998 domain-containing protein [Anaerolineaceae bacterium]|nr:DUF998 domain-containing protein [Anaerolineaceae bacterium]
MGIISNPLQRVLLSCGIIAALLYLGTDLLAGKLVKGYHIFVHSMSDLSAAGSSVRPLVLTLNLVAGVCLIAFSVGIWNAAGPAILPKIISVLITLNVLASLVSAIFFPNTLGERPVFATPGVLLMFISVLSFVLAMVFGAFAFPNWMRILSIIIPAIYILLAALRFITASLSPVKTEGLIGTQERTMVWGFLLWIVSLSIYLRNQLH